MVREEGANAALPVAEMARCVERWVVGVHCGIWQLSEGFFLGGGEGRIQRKGKIVTLEHTSRVDVSLLTPVAAAGVLILARLGPGDGSRPVVLRTTGAGPLRVTYIASTDL